MKLKDILTKKELEKIKKIGEIAAELKSSTHAKHNELNLEAQDILMVLIGEDADELIRDIINDKFVEYIDMKAREGEQ